MKELYYLIYWPEWQELANHPDFEEYSSLNTKGSDLYGPCYFIEKEWYDNLKK